MTGPEGGTGSAALRAFAFTLDRAFRWLTEPISIQTTRSHQLWLGLTIAFSVITRWLPRHDLVFFILWLSLTCIALGPGKPQR